MCALPHLTFLLSVAKIWLRVVCVWGAYLKLFVWLISSVHAVETDQ